MHGLEGQPPAAGRRDGHVRHRLTAGVTRRQAGPAAGAPSDGAGAVRPVTGGVGRAGGRRSGRRGRPASTKNSVTRTTMTRHQGGRLVPQYEDHQAEHDDEPLEGLAVAGDGVVDAAGGQPARAACGGPSTDAPARAPRRRPRWPRWRPRPGRPHRVEERGVDRVDDRGGGGLRLAGSQRRQVLVATDVGRHQQDGHRDGQARRGVDETPSPVLGQHHRDGEEDQRQDREHQGEAVEELDPPLQLGQLVRLEEDEGRPGVLRHLVEHRQAVARQRLLGLRLHLGEVYRDLPVGRLQGARPSGPSAGCRPGRGIAQRLLPQRLELRLWTSLRMMV